jgi:hypothetical protein
MGFNKLHAPEIEVLIEYLSKYGSNDFYFSYIRKREAFIGSNKSIDFLGKFMERYEKETEPFYELV